MKKKINEYIKYFSLIFGVLILVILIGCSVVTPSDPIINIFSADPATITEGESSTLSWNVTDATNVSIDNGLGSVALTGTTSVSPSKTTTYTLTATNASGSVTSTTTITVSPAEPVLLINYPMDPADTGGDGTSRGFYIEEFPGTSLTRVDLWIGSSAEGNYVFELTVREDTYDGSLIDESQATISLTDDISDKQLVTFNFPSSSIEENSTVTFKLSILSGPGSCSYAVHGQYGGIPGEDILVTQTNDTSPPLSSFRRNGIAIRVYGQE